jgi:hypothetical protein
MTVTAYFVRAYLNKNWRCFSLLTKIPLLAFCFVCLISNPIWAQEEGNQIILVPQNRTIVQRCFLKLDGVKKTFCVAVGEPNKVHYAVDLSTGTIVKIWKGDFLEATTMWTGRGQEQLAEPLGNNILTVQSYSPVIFNDLNNTTVENPPSLFKGYKLDDDGSPTFKYLIDGIEVVDRIWSTEEDTQKLNRNVKFSYNSTNGKNAKFLLAQESSIKRIKKNVYSINDKNYIITIKSKLKSEPEIQITASGLGLIIPLAGLKDGHELEYSITW